MEVGEEEDISKISNMEIINNSSSMDNKTSMDSMANPHMNNNNKIWANNNFSKIIYLIMN